MATTEIKESRLALPGPDGSYLSSVTFRYAVNCPEPWLTVDLEGLCTPPLEEYRDPLYPLFENTCVEFEDELDDGRQLWRALLAHGYKRVADAA